jgi:hypothetical protein
VSKINIDQQGIHLTTLFRLSGSDRPEAVTANAQSIFVSSNNNQLGCRVYQYSFASGRTVPRLVAVKQDCASITTDGTAVYLLLPGREEVLYWPKWDSPSPQGWPVPQIEGRGVLEFDRSGGMLIFAAESGTAYTISIPGHKVQPLASNVGVVHSVATSPDHILLASGNKVLFYGRGDHHGESPPAAMRSLPGGLITGVAVDTTPSAWIADFDNGVIQGPSPLN